MKRVIHIVFTICFLAAALTGAGQEIKGEVNKSIEQKDIISMLPPLKDLFDSAAMFSPLLKMYNSDIIIQELKIKLEKREWMETLSFEASLKFGLFDNLILTEDLGIEDLATSTTQQTRYNVGVLFKIPLSSFLNGKNVQVAELEADKLRYQKEETLTKLRQLVIVQYYNIVKAHKRMGIKMKGVKSYDVQVLQAERDFENGMINIAEYTRLLNMQSSTNLDLEDAKVEFIMAIQILKETVGADIKLKL
jgi:outer membrane protein TolC